MSFGEMQRPSGADYLSAMRRQQQTGGANSSIPIYRGRPSIRRRVVGGRKSRSRRRRRRGGFAFVPGLVSGLARVAGVLKSAAARKALSTIASTGAKTAATVGTHYGFQKLAKKLGGKGLRGGRRRRRRRRRRGVKKAFAGGRRRRRKQIKGACKGRKRTVKRRRRRRGVVRKKDIFD